MTASQTVVITRTGKQPTGKGKDEATAEPLTVTAVALTGQIRITATAATGRHGGTAQFAYTTV